MLILEFMNIRSKIKLFTLNLRPNIFAYTGNLGNTWGQFWIQVYWLNSPAGLQAMLNPRTEQNWNCFLDIARLITLEQTRSE